MFTVSAQKPINMDYQVAAKTRSETANNEKNPFS